MNINGNKEIKIFLIIESEINLIVVSEKIIMNNPIKNVINFNLEYFEFSLDNIVTRRGIKVNTKI